MTGLVRSLAIGLATIAALVRPLDGQIRGEVSDAAGRPVASARVELWAPLRQVATTTTDARGFFAFEREPEAVGVVVRRVGYATTSVPLTRDGSPVQVRLEVAPVQLAGVSSLGMRPTCPLRDDPAARDLVRTAQSRYRAPAEAVVFHSLATSLSGRVDDNPDEEPGGRPRRIWLAATTAAWDVWQRQIRSVGYAARQERSLSERYAAWLYVPLQAEYASHFADDVFAQRHAFRVTPAPGGGYSVAFCPAAGVRGTEIDGILTIAADTTISAVTWGFRTPRPNESAGGEVDFLPPSLSRFSLLLPVSYRYWRRSSEHAFYVERADFQEWRIYPGDRAPPVPRELYDPRPVQP